MYLSPSSKWLLKKVSWTVDKSCTMRITQGHYIIKKARSQNCLSTGCYLLVIHERVEISVSIIIRFL